MNGTSAKYVRRETRNRTGACLKCSKPIQRAPRGRRRLFCLFCSVVRKAETDAALYAARKAQA